MQKKIVLAVLLIIMIIIGVWLYLFFNFSAREKAKKAETSRAVLLQPEMPPIERYEFQGIEYEFISGGPVYDIITGEITKEQAKKLAEKIIGDILIKEPDAQEITILFYGDFITAGAGKVDVAEITWTPEGINIKMMQ